MANDPNVGIQVGSSEYQEHVQAEMEHYTRIFSASNPDGSSSTDTLTQWVPGVWGAVESLASQRVRERTGDDQIGHVVARMQALKNARVLSLGSGPGGIELDIARRARTGEIVCGDLNADLIGMGTERAAQERLPIRFQQMDLNTVQLEPEAYDIVFCHASLHHMIELDHIAQQIRRTLRPHGVLITVDVISRNGYLMWPETRRIVQAIWKSLPPRLRINHTAYGEIRTDDEIWETDTSESGMECIRSEEILPMLNEYFTEVVYVPYFSLCRRFFDTMYGPNYDLRFPLDAAFLNWIWQLDSHYLDAGILRPETFFGIYSLRLGRPRSCRPSP